MHSFEYHHGELYCEQVPVSRMAPKPSRLTVRSPSVQVPAAAAVVVPETMASA